MINCTAHGIFNLLWYIYIFRIVKTLRFLEILLEDYEFAVGLGIIHCSRIMFGRFIRITMLPIPLLMSLFFRPRFT